MLTTILGEFARRTGQPAPSSALINVLGRFGVGEKASRQALLRASKDGWFIPVRSGRQTLWKLTPAFEQFLNGGEEKSRYGTAGGCWCWRGLRRTTGRAGTCWRRG
jgi:phenylacetic acid degradation operon negative regulatory protein